MLRFRRRTGDLRLRVEPVLRLERDETTEEEELLDDLLDDEETDKETDRDLIFLIALELCNQKR